MKKVLAVVVSIFWLALIVGVPALVLTGNAVQFIPASLQEQLSQLGVEDLLSGLGIAPTATPLTANEPEVVMSTATPVPEVEPTATDLPTPEPEPTATIQPTSETPAVAFPVAVRGQADLRTGPGVEFDSVGLVDAGATILISAQDVTGEWFQLENGNWIASAALVSKPPVPILLPAQENATPEAPVAEVVTTPVTPATPVVARVNGDANLRSGPGNAFERVGGVAFDLDVTVVGKFATDNWYLLDSGAWIFGEMFNTAPDVPLVNADGTPATAGDPAVTAPVASPITSTTGITSTTDITSTADITPTTDITSTAGITPTTNILANLRAAPNTEAALTGSVEPGQELVIVGQNATGDWLKLESGSWIFAELVDNVPTNLPIVAEDAVEATTPEATAPESADPAQTPEAGTTDDTIAIKIAAIRASAGGITATNSLSTTALTEANLRSGPGTTFELTGSVPAGTVLTIIGRNEAGDWLKLDSNVWIFAELVANIPDDLPILTE